MTNNYSHTVLAMALGLVWSGSAAAINPPTIAQELTDGDTYVMMNYARPTKYWTRTSWDGAYYLLDYNNYLGNTGAKKPTDFTARKNDDGTWSFVYETTDADDNVTTTYLGIPSGTDNLKVMDSEVTWTVVAGDYPGYYKIYATDTNGNEYVEGLPLHLNAGGEYVVISESTYGGQWFPDVFGGVQRDELGDIMYADNGALYFNDNDHTNWAFVHEADIEEYHTAAMAYTSIKDIEENYLETEGFEDGYQLLLDATTSMYEEGGAMAEIVSLIQTKKSFQEAIVNAYELNDAGDVALQTAVDKATDIFNATNDLDEIAKAREALNNAVKVYLSGEGDFTSFGQNMSFEDLSNQGDKVSSGITDAPAGWNLYLNGKLCNTAAEIKNNGVANWCAINGDATGAKDGQYAFGIWTSSLPEVELSQTIEGLENGTYLITAGVMVGANGSGSRMTTQRLFGNLNSALFGEEYDYNPDYLNPSEVYQYAGLYEPTTDTELQDMSVSAYVYDGTLTFGFRTNGEWRATNHTAANAAGGDGWFKIDNFRINYLGYDPSDAENILFYYQDLLAQYSEREMQASVAAQLEDLMNLEPGSDAIDAAIMQCRDYISVVKSSIDAYAAMREYIDLCFEYCDEYAEYNGIGKYVDVVTEVYEMLDNAELDEAGLAEQRARLEEALTELRLSGVSEGKDVTELIANPSFEANAGNSSGIDVIPEGWNLYLDGVQCKTTTDIRNAGVTAWCAANKGDDVSGLGLYDEDGELITKQPTDGDHLWGIWNENIPEVELSQTLEGLPAGTYTMTADVMVQWNWAGDCLTTQRIFANNAICMYGRPDFYLKNATPDMLAAIEMDRQAGFHIEADDYAAELEEEEDADVAPVANELDDEDIDAYRMMNYANVDYCDSRAYDLLQTLTLKFVVTEDGKATIGFRTNNVNRQGVPTTSRGIGWFKVDNFTLYYESKDIPTAVKGAQVSSTATGIYTLDGIRLNVPRKGFNIMQLNGKTYKVIIK